MNTALVIVDVQADFCSGGALAVPDADAVIPVVNELIAGFGVPPDAKVVRKGTSRDQDSYSAFFENDRKTRVGLDALLREAGVGEILLAGLATDCCVLNTAWDARTLGYDVTVIESGCRGIDTDGSLAAAWDRMARAGVRRA